MARKFRYLVTALAFSVVLLTGVAALTQTDTEQSVQLSLQPGAPPLPPGNYNVEINAPGRRMTARIEVSAAPTPANNNSAQTVNTSNNTVVKGQPGTTPTAGSSSSILTIALAALIPALLIAFAAWFYFKVYLPRKELEPYTEGLRLLRSKKYDEALPLLTRMEGKLPEELRRDARFFIAFAYHQLKDSTEAERRLDALYREDSSDAQTAYLLAHIRVDEERYDEAEAVLETMEQNKQLGLHFARKLLGIVKFRRAMAALKEKRVEVAASLFEKVQALGDFAAQIPADLRNRHVALGTEALFNKDADGARQQFESLQKAAGNAPEEQRRNLRATAQLGLALVKWIENDGKSFAAIESMLVEAAQTFDPQGPVELSWPTGDTDKGILEQLKILDAVDELSPEQKDFNRCLRDIHFLRGVARLQAWGMMDGATAHAQIQKHFDSALARFACARARDELFSDVLLVVGLLMYYLYKPGPQRNQAVDLLEQSRKLGMHDPDALEIVNNRQRIERANANAVDKYLQVLDQYINDQTVRSEVRASLIERLSKYQRIQDWGKNPQFAQMRDVEPTLAEVRHRSELLLVRVNQILSSRGDSIEAGQLKALSETILRESEKLTAQAATIEKQESELLVLTGTQLLKEQ
jgi:hypothetical protein